MNQEEISNLIPANGKMIVRLFENKEVTEGGVIYNPYDNPFNKGEVVSVHGSSKSIPFANTNIEMGDTVLWGKVSGQLLSSEADSEVFFVVHVDEVIAISKIKNNKEEQ